MTGHDTTERVIHQMLREKLGLDVPAPETDLLQSGIVDSLALIELIVHLEETFSILIPMDKLDIEGFCSISKIAAFVERHKAASHGENTRVC
jgi:D-alanine--poly(phosphoribitol) ligase subunit 2